MQLCEVVKHWDMICAFKEGKELQYKYISTPEADWQEASDPTFKMNVIYRVKPESRTLRLIFVLSGKGHYVLAATGYDQVDFDIKVQQINKEWSDVIVKEVEYPI